MQYAQDKGIANGHPHAARMLGGIAHGAAPCREPSLNTSRFVASRLLNVGLRLALPYPQIINGGERSG
ncbi:hypothetical protein [Mangrovicoccus algicola]|uniref:Uncharacterized protein n=1 Tax=Mangrovicoccus algicola TaxID=2771008 RepID=A0A8J6Z906_9RHOB|nr:hypothetical protein [Mangrovicoccus algicola]MBE3638111.1 hypothetical protein [Mangrovicoccus algicola]